MAMLIGFASGAQRNLAELRSESRRVVECLDAFGRAYRGTFAAKAA